VLNEQPDPEQDLRRRGYILVGVVVAVGMLVTALRQAREGEVLGAVLAGAACLVCAGAAELSRRGRLKVAAVVLVGGVVVLGMPGYLGVV
jgi:hypothetical protein